MKTTQLALLLGATVVVAGIGSGVAVASSGTSAATVHACADKKTGSLRVASTCTSSERVVDWGVVGPRGARGPVGTAGATGPQGVPGGTGLQGPAGPALGSSTVLVESGDVGLGAAGAIDTGVAVCPAGMHVVGTGYTNHGENDQNIVTEVEALQIKISPGRNYVSVTLENNNRYNDAVIFRAQAECAS